MPRPKPLHDSGGGREAKYALTKALAAAAKDFLIDCAGQDLPEDMYALDDFTWEIQPLTKNSFMIRAKPMKEGKPMNRPAHMFEVSITGGG
jgi:hypothetical protein